MRARWQGTCLTRSLGQPSRPPYYSFFLSSLLNPALTERKECFQRSPNLGMPLSWCSSPLGGLPTLPTCGERAGRATGQDWADAAAELGPGEQPAEQMLGSPGKMWADAQEHQQDFGPELCLSRIWSGSEARQLSSATSASLPPKGTSLPGSHHHLLLELNSSLHA